MIANLLTYFAACPAKGIPFLPPWYKYLGEENPGAVPCQPKFVFPDDINRILLAVFEMALVIGGMVAVAFIIYGGFQYMTSQGEPDKAKAGRTTVVNAVVGLVIASLAAAIVNLVARNLA